MRYRNLEGGFESTFIARLAKARFYCAATLVHGNRICIVGGIGETYYVGSASALASVHWLDLSNRTFSDGPELNRARN